MSSIQAHVDRTEPGLMVDVIGRGTNGATAEQADSAASFAGSHSQVSRWEVSASGQCTSSVRRSTAIARNDYALQVFFTGTVVSCIDAVKNCSSHVLTADS